MAELPEEPDVAVFCLGNARVLGAFVAAAERGIKGAVIYDGGFAEQGEDGRRLQGQIEGICREADIALCGPNCMGVLNPYHLSTTYLQELRNRDPKPLGKIFGDLIERVRFARARYEHCGVPAFLALSLGC
jgi:acyl-CoA synthetase (NDP forming)